MSIIEDEYDRGKVWSRMSMIEYDYDRGWLWSKRNMVRMIIRIRMIRGGDKKDKNEDEN